METVLFFQTKTATPSREKLTGAFRYIEAANWDIRLVEANPCPKDVRAALRRWQPIGCIVDRGLARGQNPVRLFAGIPVVYFDQNPTTAKPGGWHVRHDSAATVRVAFTELVRENLKHFAFVQDARGTYWSGEREESFAALVRRRGGTLAILREGLGLVEQLAALPRPCGLLAASDFIARKVLDAAQKAELRVPDELRVVGINNDVFLCEHTKPTLTSVHPDFENGGYLALALLHQLIERKAVAPRTVLFGPKELVRRSSTRILNHPNARVMRALDYLAVHFADPNLSSDQIAIVMGCSRRLADLRFRESTGHTIRDEIHTLRIERAKRLLAEGTHGLMAICNLCGYRSPTTFMRLFKAITGRTLGETRRRRGGFRRYRG